MAVRDSETGSDQRAAKRAALLRWSERCYNAGLGVAYLAGVAGIIWLFLSQGLSLWLAIPVALVGGLPFGVSLGGVPVLLLSHLGQKLIDRQYPAAEPRVPTPLSPPLAPSAEAAARDNASAAAQRRMNIVGAWVLAAWVVWFAVGYFLDQGKGFPGWFMLIFFAIPLVAFAACAAAEYAPGTFTFQVRIPWEEESVFGIGIVWILAALGFSNYLPIWAACLLAVPTAVAVAVGLVLTFKLLVWAFLRFRH